MGRLYRPIEVSTNNKSEIIVGLIDTGADESVVSEKLAKKLGLELYGTYKATCASQYSLIGSYSDLKIKDLKTGKEAVIKIGVSDIPFDTDDIDEEGLEIILGVDFIQKTQLVNI